MVNKSTLQYLEDLLRNNNREWFANNRSQYDDARTNVVEIAAELIEKINRFDPSLGYHDPSKTLFRIYRDVRFSHNKDPYKTHFGIALGRDGSANGVVGSSYYLHIEPENSFLATGIYMPTTKQLVDIRTDIEYNWDEFQSILNEKRFKEQFSDLERTDNILKRAPKGFSIESPAIEYLKLKSFYVYKQLDNELLMREDSTERIVTLYNIAAPLHHFLNKSVANK